MRANRRNAFSLVPCKSILKADSFVDARVQEFLDGELTTEFESGRGVGALLSVLGQLRGLPPPAPLASLRGGASPVAKLYNWNLLAPALRPFGVELDADAKARIVAGDFEVVARLLHSFYERLVKPLPGAGGGNSAAPQPPAAAPMAVLPRASMLTEPGEGQSDRALFAEIQGDGSSAAPTPRPPPEAAAAAPLPRTRFAPQEAPPAASTSAPTGSAADLLVETLVECNQLGLDGSTAQLVARETPHELQAWLIEGKPSGDFGGVLAWLRLLLSRGAHLAELLGAEGADARGSILSTLAAGLRSRSRTMVGMCMRVLSAVARQLSHSGGDTRSAEMYEWFVGPGGALRLLLGAWATHSGDEVVAASIAVIDRFARRHLDDLFEQALTMHVAEPRAQLAAARRMLPHIAAHAGMRRAFSDAGVISGIASRASRYADGSAPGELKVEAGMLATKLWAHFPAELEASADSVQGVLGLLKRGCREPDQHVAEASHQCLVDLLEAFAADGNAFAPVVFKALVFSLVENWRNVGVRTLLDDQLARLFRANQGLAVGTLVEPMCKHAALTAGDSVGGGAGTLAAGIRAPLLDALAAHGRLEARHAALLIPLLARSALQTDDEAAAAEAAAGTGAGGAGAYGNHALWPLVAMARRFERVPEVLGQLERFATLCMRALHEPLGAPGSAQRQAAALDALESLLGVGSAALCAQLAPLAREACADWRAVNDTPHPRLEELCRALEEGVRAPDPDTREAEAEPAFFVGEEDAAPEDGDSAGARPKREGRAASPVSTLEAEASGNAGSEGGSIEAGLGAGGFPQSPVKGARRAARAQQAARERAQQQRGRRQQQQQQQQQQQRGRQDEGAGVVPGGFDKAAMLAAMGWTEEQWSAAMAAANGMHSPQPQHAQEEGEPAQAARLGERGAAAKRRPLHAPRSGGKQDLDKQEQVAARRAAKEAAAKQRREAHTGGEGGAAGAQGPDAGKAHKVDARIEAEALAAAEAEREERRRAAMRRRLADEGEMRRQEMKRRLLAKRAEEIDRARQRRVLKVQEAKEKAEAEERRQARIRRRLAKKVKSENVRARRQIFFSAGGASVESSPERAPPAARGRAARPGADADEGVPPGFMRVLVSPEVPTLIAAVANVAEPDGSGVPVAPAGLSADEAAVELCIDELLADGGVLGEHVLPLGEATAEQVAEVNVMLRLNPKCELPPGFAKRPAVAGTDGSKEALARLSKALAADPDAPLPPGYVAVAGPPLPARYEARLAPTGEVPAAPLSAPTPTRRAPKPKRPLRGGGGSSSRRPPRSVEAAATAPRGMGVDVGRRPLLPPVRVSGVGEKDAKAKAFIGDFVDSLLAALSHRAVTQLAHAEVGGAPGGAVAAAMSRAAMALSPTRPPIETTHASIRSVKEQLMAEGASGSSFVSPKTAARQADAKIRRAKRAAKEDQMRQRLAFEDERRRQQAHAAELRSKLARQRQERHQRQKVLKAQKEQEKAGDAKERAAKERAVKAAREAQKKRVLEYRRKRAAAEVAKREAEEREKAEARRRETELLEKRRLKLHKRLIDAGKVPMSVIEGKDDLSGIFQRRAEEEAAAVKIQAVARGRLGRKTAAKRRVKREHKAASTEVDAVLDALLEEISAEE